MKYVNLLLWVGQFGFSVIFPTVFFLWLAALLQEKYGFGAWILILMGVLGLATSFTTARSCLRSLLKAAAEVSGGKEPPVSFNKHT